MIKKSKVKSVQANGKWEGKFGLMYKFEIEMDNGDLGEYSSKVKEQDKFVKGQETEYEFIDGNFPKIKPVYQKPSFGNFKDNSDRQESIIRQSTLKCAVEYLKGAEASLEEVFDAAEQMIAWVNKKEINKTVKEELQGRKEMYSQDQINSFNNDDLPF